MLLFQSMKKSKIMKEIEQSMNKKMSVSMSNLLAGRDDEVMALFRKLYDIESRMNCFSGIIDKTNPNELHQLAERISLVADYNNNRDYLPIALLSFPQPLSIVLTNKDVILNGAYNEWIHIINVANQNL